MTDKQFRDLMKKSLEDQVDSLSRGEIRAIKKSYAYHLSGKHFGMDICAKTNAKRARKIVFKIYDDGSIKDVVVVFT